MKSQDAARKSGIFLLASFSVCLLAAQEQAAKPITGSPGVVVSRNVVNFSELARREASLPTRPPVPKVQPPEHERPARKALPPGAIIKLAPKAAINVPAAVGPPNPRTVLLSNSFPAEADNSTVIPPDTQGTVGPNHLMVTLNNNVVVQDRSGNRLKTVSLDAFWAPTGNSVTTDPRVAYDPLMTAGSSPPRATF